MFSVQYGTTKIEYNIIKSKRKTISISVDQYGTVLIKAPLRMTDSAIQEVVRKKSHWIVEKTAMISEYEKERPDRRYMSGEVFEYRGNEFLLQLISNQTKKRPVVEIVGNQLVVTTSSSETDVVKTALAKWYKNSAKEKIPERVAYYERFIPETCVAVIVKEQKRRWGSCSQDGTIRLNWRLIMAPEIVLDYVVVHEMCHLRHMNHSAQFWGMVESIMPDYKNCREWLKKNGVRLEL